jgi:putative spermidine/putrescine transport system substrate-binding protein
VGSLVARCLDSLLRAADRDGVVRPDVLKGRGRLGYSFADRVWASLTRTYLPPRVNGPLFTDVAVSARGSTSSAETSVYRTSQGREQTSRSEVREARLTGLGDYLILASAIAVIAGAAFFAISIAGSHTDGDGGVAGCCGGTAGGVPTASLPLLKHVGKGERKLNLVAWRGYLNPIWVKPFERQTGCTVHATYAASSDQMVALMQNGGGGLYDMVSSSGDADLRIIYAGDARPVNIKLIPSWTQFFPALQSPPFNTVNGIHYGISLQWGPNVLMFSRRVFKTPPTSWRVIYSKKYADRISIPDNPLQIADAALYLRVHDPSLDINDPYELTQQQFQAAVNLLVRQHPLVKQYWRRASDQIVAFANRSVVVGPSWLYQASRLAAKHVAVGSVIPSEGATAWADTWMLAAKAPHPNCAYMWMRYISRPQVQAEQAVNYGETPVNMLACRYMNRLRKGSCSQYHAEPPTAYFRAIAFWKTPIVTCDNGQSFCVPYGEWVSAWDAVVRQ